MVNNKPSLILSSIIILFLLIGVNIDSYSQEYNRANIWYFGDLAGLDFSTGEPVALYDGMLSTGGTCRGSVAMCDTNSSLLFYSNGLRIWNANHGIIDPQFLPGSYDVISFPKIGSDHEYYIFSVPNYWNGSLDHFYYSIIDMSLNGGLGGASQPVKLGAIWDSGQKLTATRHKNKKDVWVVLRKIIDDHYASILVTEDSVYSQPVIGSPAPSFVEDSLFGCSEMSGQIKISYDNKYLINTYIGLHNNIDTSVKSSF